MGPWQWAWVLWIATFGVLETWAIRLELRGYVGATLSENLRAWLGLYPHRWYRLVGAALVVGGCIWFGVHMVVQH